MARHTLKLREEARQVYLTGEVTSVAEIARRLRVKPHTVGRWKRDEDWDALRLKIDKRAAEQLVERLATERVNLNAQHFKLWNAVVGRLFGVLSKDGLKGEDIRTLEKAAAILERAQKGQRLARGLSLDGQTEEQIRAESEAEVRALIDLFIDVIKTEVPDEDLRDRISRAILARVPVDDDLGQEPS
jgi:DNA invertase Pin-like site-specific DNA recombinase